MVVKMYRSSFCFSQNIRQLLKYISTKSKRKRASAFLSAIFTLSAGAFFIVGVSQLTRFVIAQNAVEQAARSAARCLTPTDSKCTDNLISLNESNHSQQDYYNWYGEQLGSFNPTNYSVNQYRYNLSLVSATYNVDYNTYKKVVTETGAVSWDSYQIPFRSFRPIKNQYYTLMAPMKMTASKMLQELKALYYVPSYAQQWDLYAGKFNDGIGYNDVDASLSDWMSGRRLNGTSNTTYNVADGFVAANLNVQSNGSFSRQPDATNQRLHLHSTGQPRPQEFHFSSNEVMVPRLEGYNPAQNIQPQCKEGSVCGVSSAFDPNDVFKGYDNSVKDFRDVAFVLVKVFAEIEPITPGQPVTVGWYTTNNNGIFIDIYNANNQRVGWPYEVLAEEPGWRMGGRQQMVINSTSQYNLNLRGSSGANGGSNPSSAVTAHGIYHNPIQVPRGGKFKIDGFLRVSGAASVKASIYYFVENYDLKKEYATREVKETHSCAEKKYINSNNGNISCSSKDKINCGFDATWKFVSCERDKKYPLQKTPYCNKPTAISPSYLWTESNTQGVAIDLSLCLNLDARPTLSPEYYGQVNDKDRLWCGWNPEVGIRYQSNELKPNNCPTAKSNTQTFSCKEYRKVDGSTKINSETCPGLPAVKTSSESKIFDVNGNLSFESERNYSWIRFPYYREDFSWQSGSLAEEKAPEKHNINVTRYEPVNGGNITLADISAILETSHGVKIPENYTDFQGKLVKTTLLPLTGGIFNDSPTNELPEFGSTENNCQRFDHENPAVVERELRKYGAAAEPLVSLEQGKKVVANAIKGNPLSKVVYQTPSCSKSENEKPKDILNCVLNIEPSDERCESTKVQRIGEYPKGEVPAGCKNGDYQNCQSYYSRSDEFSEYLTADNNSAFFDKEPAIKSAQKELVRAFGNDISLDCPQAGCAKIEIIENNADLDAADIGVKVSYKLPLYLPFAELLGSDYFEISTTKEEVSELKAIVLNKR